MSRINRRIITGCPAAMAQIKGSDKYPDIGGHISFFPAPNGTVVFAEITGLPSKSGFFALHIHNGKECTGTAEKPFANAGTHLDFDHNEHPFHTGDLPVILSNNGYAWSAVYTQRFTPCQVKGYTAIIHLNPDDYRTQPSGDSGEMIACGVIH